MEENIEYQDPFDGQPVDPKDNKSPFDDEDEDFYEYWKEIEEERFERAMNDFFENRYYGTE